MIIDDEETACCVSMSCQHVVSACGVSMWCQHVNERVKCDIYIAVREALEQ